MPSGGRKPIIVHSSRSTVPASASSFFRTMEKSVDLPAPFGPTSATRSP